MKIENQRKNALGVASLCAFLFGGGTDAYLVVDSVLQFIMVAASIFVLSGSQGEPQKSVAVWFGISAIAICMVQLVPLPIEIARFGREELFENARFGLDGLSWHAVSLAPGRTVDSLLWVMSLTIYAAAVSSLEPRQRETLISYFLVGTLLNVVFALMSYAAVRSGKIEFVGYYAAAGIFANANHFGTLVFATMVLMIFYLLRRGMLLAAIAYCVLALITLFATSSRAAALVGIIVAVLGAAVIFAGRRSLRIGLGAAIGLACLAYFGLAQQMQVNELSLDAIRSEAFATTWRAAWDNLPFGTGFGTFLNAYKSYETEIFRVQINHAHNDYVELVLEGGIFIILLIIAFFIYFGYLITRSHVESAPALIGLLAILIHSLVDYPLRTYAISVLATFLFVMAAEGAHRKCDKGARRAGSLFKKRSKPHLEELAENAA
ncbi:O-antigen ligase family protein [Notoacmeibacter marinus]|uniref:O-antigen ligase family protein n=1 Tax=Notoacmeibacter marinus TaxID=1876515 RepID=UPI000DF2C2A8|nr:O-antigen ligase family protein [Notoacmeibacter marinus]